MHNLGLNWYNFKGVIAIFTTLNKCIIPPKLLHLQCLAEIHYSATLAKASNDGINCRVILYK